MTEEQLQAYTKLPPAESFRLIDFDRAEIVILDGCRPTRLLTVTGTKPFVNMEVDLVPLVYIRQPDYWGIEVTGRLPGMGLPALAPYTVSLPLEGFVGTEDIEVIGATRSEMIKVAEEGSLLGCSDWSAVHNHEPPGPAVLYVRGKCRFPIAGYSVELKRREPQGVNPRDLLLDRIAHPLNDQRPSVERPKVVEVEYREETAVQYDTVTILPDGASMQVQVVH